MSFFRYASRETYRQTDIGLQTSQYFAALRGQSNKLNLHIPAISERSMAT